jgi:N6-L-threonylcarbamoyladenine synthase
MGILRPYLLNKLRSKYSNVFNTYGYITKNVRINNNLEKHHYIDARCISGNPSAINDTGIYKLVKNRKHNRQIHKFTINKGGNRKLNQSPFEVFGFRLFDKVRFKGKTCFINGRRLSGRFTIKDIDSNMIKDGISYKKLKRLELCKSYKMDLIKIV